MSKKLFSLEGKVALVTGGGRGIGAAIAKGFAEAGAIVACAARTRSQLDETVAAIESSGGKALAVTMDLAERQSMEDGVEQIQSQLGGIDILVNNAGMNVREPIEEVTEAHYDQIMAVNLKGLFFLTQSVIPHLKRKGGGKIINIGSITTGYGLTSIPVYAATKGAVGQLSKAFAVELAPHNIQVNTLCPGFVLTPLTKKLWSDPVMKDWGERRIPIGRMATPEEMVGTALFFASAASDYITGQEVYVDGGYTACERWPIPEGGGNR